MNTADNNGGQLSATKQALDDILTDISWRGLANRYFGKSSSWMYHKINGTDGTNKVALTDAETKQLKDALCDLADRIRKCAGSL